MTEEIKKLISEAKNIYIIPSANTQEAVPNALALFYTLKEMGKNVNLLEDNFPEKFMYLVPSLDFISYPRNFVLSVPADVANVSQIYYEKNNDALKIHLTLDKGIIKKDNISFYYSDVKPDLIITLGVKDYTKQLEKLDSFGFLLDTPIINIDSVDNASTSLGADGVQNNLNFGKINIVEAKALYEITLNLIKSFDENLIKKDVANCLLSGLIMFSENFRNEKTNSEILETASYLMKKGGEREKIVSELFKTKLVDTNKEIVAEVIAKLAEQNLEINKENILKYLES